MKHIFEVLIAFVVRLNAADAPRHSSVTLINSAISKLAHTKGQHLQMSLQ